MEIKTFYKKNELGVSIEYGIIGTYKINEERKYLIYTDFVPEDNSVGFRIFVDEIVGNMQRKLDEATSKKIIENLNYEILNQVTDGEK